MQQSVLWITVFLTLIVILIFWKVIRASAQDVAPEKVVSTSGTIRQILFWISLIAGGGLLYSTLSPWPHAVADISENPIIVSVTGSQWSWAVSQDQVPVGKKIIFTVTSTDVNHGMGIYNSNYKLLTQVQGMPGYVNRVQYTFTEPGTYRLLCMEYCGLAHHDMISEITVTAAE